MGSEVGDRHMKRGNFQEDRREGEGWPYSASHAAPHPHLSQ